MAVAHAVEPATDVNDQFIATCRIPTEPPHVHGIVVALQPDEFVIVRDGTNDLDHIGAVCIQAAEAGGVEDIAGQDEPIRLYPLKKLSDLRGP